MKIEIDLSEVHVTAIGTVAVDPAEWIRNAAEARAITAIAEHKTKPAWMQAAMAVMQAGGDFMNDEAVFMKGVELDYFLPVPVPTQMQAEDPDAGGETPAE